MNERSDIKSEIVKEKSVYVIAFDYYMEHYDLTGDKSKADNFASIIEQDYEERDIDELLKLTEDDIKSELREKEEMI